MPLANKQRSKCLAETNRAPDFTKLAVSFGYVCRVSSSTKIRSAANMVVESVRNVVMSDCFSTADKSRS